MIIDDIDILVWVCRSHGPGLMLLGTRELLAEEPGKRVIPGCLVISMVTFKSNLVSIIVG